MRWLFVSLVACRSHDEPKPLPAPPPSPPKPLESFVRIPPEQAVSLHYQASPRGEYVGHMELIGGFLCRLEKRFGRGDPYVPQADGTVLGFPLRHVASGELIVALVGNPSWGYAGADTPKFTAVMNELDGLLAKTAPIDCEYTYPETIRVDHAGVRDGKPFFEHVGLAQTLEMRLAQLEYNDAHGGDRRVHVERELCYSAEINWGERRDGGVMGAKAGFTPGAPGFDAFARKDALKARLVHCMESALAEFEDDIVKDAFDADAEPEEIADLEEKYADIVGRGPLSGRIKRARAAIARGHR